MTRALTRSLQIAPRGSGRKTPINRDTYMCPDSSHPLLPFYSMSQSNDKSGHIYVSQSKTHLAITILNVTPHTEKSGHIYVSQNLQIHRDTSLCLKLTDKSGHIYVSRFQPLFSFSYSLVFSLQVNRDTYMCPGSSHISGHSLLFTSHLTCCSHRFLRVVHICSRYYTPRFSTVHTKILAYQQL